MTEIDPAEIEALVKEWREAQERMTLPKSGITGEGMAFKTCADDLEELLDDE